MCNTLRCRIISHYKHKIQNTSHRHFSEVVLITAYPSFRAAPVSSQCWLIHGSNSFTHSFHQSPLTTLCSGMRYMQHVYKGDMAV